MSSGLDPGTLEMVEFSVALVLNAVLTFAVVATDERWLAYSNPELLDRAWPSSTRLSASIAFGPLCLPIHFWRTRTSVLRRLLGLAAAAGVILVVQAIVVAIDLLA
ncbi:MAG: hypothetical protein JWM74_4990 [Myxococcaceae bacterium]|nr:hypothetical protein [Myxococcaceae bacterium]